MIQYLYYLKNYMTTCGFIDLYSNNGSPLFSCMSLLENRFIQIRKEFINLLAVLALMRTFVRITAVMAGNSICGIISIST